jgi:hypothetical protein
VRLQCVKLLPKDGPWAPALAICRTSPCRSLDHWCRRKSFESLGEAHQGGRRYYLERRDPEFKAKMAGPWGFISCSLRMLHSVP